MRFLIVLFFLLGTVVYSIRANSLQEALSLVGGKCRELERNQETVDLNDTKWQFFYFCETKKNNKTCGSWVDEKGNKVKGANNNVKRTKQGATISKLTTGDSGFYTRVPENPDENQAYLERVRLHVQAPPPPPPKY